MKLRLQGSSLRLRVTRPELNTLLISGRIQETTRFSPQPNAALTFALECAACKAVNVHHGINELTVVLPWEVAHHWAQESEVSITAAIDVGGTDLAVLVEKDFACLHSSDEENAGSFPNPRQNIAGPA